MTCRTFSQSPCTRGEKPPPCVDFIFFFIVVDIMLEDARGGILQPSKEPARLHLCRQSLPHQNAAESACGFCWGWRSSFVDFFFFFLLLWLALRLQKKKKSGSLGGEHAGSIIHVTRVSARRVSLVTLSAPADRQLWAGFPANLGQSPRLAAAGYYSNTEILTLTSRILNFKGFCVFPFLCFRFLSRGSFKAGVGSAERDQLDCMYFSRAPRRISSVLLLCFVSARLACCGLVLFGGFGRLVEVAGVLVYVITM